MQPFEESILKTLHYFDLLNFPLTEEELFRYLWQPPRMGYAEFVQTLRGMSEANDAVSRCLGRPIPKPQDSLVQGDRHAPRLRSGLAMTPEKSGYYFFAGRENLVAERQEATKITEQKLIRARRAVKLIRSVPFLRAIFVCNSVGAGMARPDSDIDWFIVAEKNRVWLVRLFTNLILRLFGLRTYGAHQANRVCLSFYVDAGHLDLAPWRIADDDIHFAYWLNQMIPLYDPKNYYEKLLTANKWVEHYLPRIRYSFPAKQFPTVSDSRLGKMWKGLWQTMWSGKYGDTVENEAKKLQLTKLKFYLKEKFKDTSKGIVIESGIIKLHEHDSRAVIRQKWLERVRALM